MQATAKRPVLVGLRNSHTCVTSTSRVREGMGTSSEQTHRSVCNPQRRQWMESRASQRLCVRMFLDACLPRQRGLHTTIVSRRKTWQNIMDVQRPSHHNARCHERLG